MGNDKRRRTSFGRLPIWKRIFLVFGFLWLCYFGLVKTVVLQTGRFFSRSLLKTSPSLWRFLFMRRTGDSFEDYSERRIKKAETELLPKDRLGLAGERAVFELIKSGRNNRVVACNVSNYYCELDLIYLDKPCREIVFVEVKTRRRENYVRPTVEAVDAKRRKKIALAARQFCSERGYGRYKRRYDIAIVIWGEEARPEITILKGAFTEAAAILEYRGTDYGKAREPLSET